MKRKKNSKKRMSRKHLLNAAKLLISVTLITWLLQRIGLDTILEQIRTADVSWIFVAVIMFAVSNVLGAVQWYLLMRSQQVNVSLGHAISYYHVGLFFNNFLIGYVGGDAFRIYDIRRHSGDTTAAVSTVVFDRFIGFLMVTSIAMSVSLIWIRQLASLDTVYFIAAILLGWFFMLFLLFNQSAGKKFGRICSPFVPGMLQEKILSMSMALNQFRHNRLLLIQVLAISLVVQLLRVMVHYWAALSVGVSVSMFYFLIFVPIIALFASLPISFGGIGVREQSGVAVFSTIGVMASKVVTFEFLAYIVGIVATIPGGLIFALRKEETLDAIRVQNTVQHSSLQKGGSYHEKY